MVLLENARGLGVRVRSCVSVLLHRLASQSSPWRRAGLVVAVCLALAVVSASDALHEAILQVLVVLDDLISRHPFVGAALFVAAAAVTAMVTFVSIAVVVPAAVLAWGEIQSIVLLWVGWVLGGLGAYAIGRILGRPIAHAILASDALQGLEHRLQRDAPFWFVFLLQLALPSEILGYGLGMVRYPPSRYLLALSLAELPYTIATVQLGASFVSGRASLIFAAGLSLALIGLAAFYSLRRLARTRAAPQSTAEHV